LLDFAGLYFSLVLVSLYLFLAFVGYRAPLFIIEKNEKGKLKIEPIKEEEIERAIKNLKPGKSPDIDGISADHYKNAMDELKPLILHILNRMSSLVSATWSLH
jgi:hypothetical protein